jgi:hypothetical protein
MLYVPIWRKVVEIVRGRILWADQVGARTAPHNPCAVWTGRFSVRAFAYFCFFFYFIFFDYFVSVSFSLQDSKMLKMFKTIKNHI